MFQIINKTASEIARQEEMILGKFFHTHHTHTDYYYVGDTCSDDLIEGACLARQCPSFFTNVLDQELQYIEFTYDYLYSPKDTIQACLATIDPEDCWLLQGLCILQGVEKSSYYDAVCELDNIFTTLARSYEIAYSHNLYQQVCQHFNELLEPNDYEIMIDTVIRDSDTYDVGVYLHKDAFMNEAESVEVHVDESEFHLELNDNLERDMLDNIPRFSINESPYITDSEIAAVFNDSLFDYLLDY